MKCASQKNLKETLKAEEKKKKQLEKSLADVSIYYVFLCYWRLEHKMMPKKVLKCLDNIEKENEILLVGVF